MFCKNCGAQLIGKFHNCPRCGVQVQNGSNGGLYLAILILSLMAIGGYYMYDSGINLSDITIVNSSPEVASDPVQANVDTCEEIAKEYYESHTYLNQNIYDCDDMSKDVWNLVVSTGMNAVIMVGNVSSTNDTIENSNHAWVLAEVGEDQWIAIECTRGVIVYQKDYPEYYIGTKFANPKELDRFYEAYFDESKKYSEYKDYLSYYNALVTSYEASPSGDNKSYLKGRIDEAYVVLCIKETTYKDSKDNVEGILNAQP